MYPRIQFKVYPAGRSGWMRALAAIIGMFACTWVAAMEFNPGNSYWYVPEHEKFGRTAFYAQSTFRSPEVRVTRMQRMRLLGAQKGWALVEFDVAGRAYVHLRVLRNIAYDPTVSDLWHEFKRASLFNEEPAKIEARLNAEATTKPAVTTDSKVPAWKRYKEGWNVNTGRASPPAPTGDSDSGPSEPRYTRPGAEKKPRAKIPIIPPFGADPTPTDAANPGSAPTDPDAKPAP